MNFWPNQRVVVTGGAGFVGCNLVRRLLREGARVTVLDDLFTGRRDIGGAALPLAVTAMALQRELRLAAALITDRAAQASTGSHRHRQSPRLSQDDPTPVPLVQ